MNATADNTTTSDGDTFYHAAHGDIRTVLCVSLALSCYAPVAIALYVWRRRHPAIRYCSPIEMAVTAMAAFLNGFTRCLVVLFMDRVSCSCRILAFGIPLQIALVGYTLAELRVVLTFHLTELMVAHASRRRQANKHTLPLLHACLRRGWLSASVHLLVYVVSNMPFFAVLYSKPASTRYDAIPGTQCPVQLIHDVAYLLSAEFGLTALVSFVLSFQLSRVIDNFGLRQSFLACGRAFVLFLVAYYVLLIWFYDTPAVVTYHIDVFLNLAMDHTLIWFHVLCPLRASFYTPHECCRDASATLQGSAAVLDAFLRTPDGHAAFSTFAAAEFALEAVLAWKSLSDFQARAAGHMTAADIYAQFIGPAAPLSLDCVVESSVLRRFATALEANQKYAVHPTGDDDNSDGHYFDVLLDAVMAKCTNDLLPRFQRHPLGVDWFTFLVKFHTQVALDTVLDETTTDETRSLQTMATVQGNAAFGRSMRHLAPIPSWGDSTTRSSRPVESSRDTGHSQRGTGGRQMFHF
ncbi:Aste57867_23557 [Aphanomyces stellatus]|uniref:Aste57867_23557 protein n=1 Tax=Aphanomyces stellatus TaxID=120398 RepID=A0A485LSJ2_9STRA|nr:hypothetical protein As57867_023486 [Aphanomyces stellatus]VFU00202.1 Aste57867_23557 [Aphanomyces stellatus]